jgi:hypothetical protein
MQNAKKEFIEHTSGKVILCAFIEHEPNYDKRIPYSLPCGFSESHLQYFLQSLDFDYDSGFGGQELYGHIWYSDGTWSSRGEYDGSEWWDYNSCPPIPKECAADTKEKTGTSPNSSTTPAGN